MGTVSRRGNQWTIRLDLPPGPDGKRRRRRVSCKGLTKREAEAKLVQIQSQIQGNRYVEPSTLTLADFLADWLDSRRDQLALRTIERYTELVNSHIVPALGSIALANLRPLHLQTLYASALKHGRLDGAGGLSPKTVHHIHGVLHAALAQALRWQALSVNPAAQVEPPSVPRSTARDARPDEIALLLPAIERSRYRLPILIALGTGLRRGEICALRWEDVSEMDYIAAGVRRRGCVLSVRRAAVQTSDGAVTIKQTKTGRARAVLLPEFLVSELHQVREAESHAVKPNLTDWICTTPAGEPIPPKWLGNQFSRLARSAGLQISLHSLRHTQSTVLLMSGLPVNVVSERAGHANASTTLDIYAHVALANQQPAVEVLNAFFEQFGLPAHGPTLDPPREVAELG